MVYVPQLLTDSVSAKPVPTISCHALIFVTAVSTPVLGRRKESSDVEEGYLTAARAKTHPSHHPVMLVPQRVLCPIRSQYPEFCSVANRPGHGSALPWRSSGLSFGLIAQLKTLIFGDPILYNTQVQEDHYRLLRNVISGILGTSYDSRLSSYGWVPWDILPDLTFVGAVGAHLPFSPSKTSSRRALAEKRHQHSTYLPSPYPVSGIALLLRPQVPLTLDA